MRRSGCCLGLSALRLAQAGAASGTTAKAVSPGSLVEELLIADRCPTFSWTGVAAAAGYELVVYAIRGEDDVPEAAPALHVEIPGGALSWTPARRDCLAPDSGYVWVIRAMVDGSTGDWSEALRFQTPGEIPEEELVAAVVLLRRYVESGGSLEAIAPPASGPVAAGTAVDPEQDLTPARELVRLSTPADSPDSPGARRAHTRQPELPIGTLGINSSIGTADNAVALRGGQPGSVSGDVGPIVGYFAADVGDTTEGDWDGFPQLWILGTYRIGVLGFAGEPSDPTSGAAGVVGVGEGNAWAGAFANVNADGVPQQSINLAGRSGVIYAVGDSVLDGDVDVTGSLACPEGTHRAGAWCIGSSQIAATYYAAAQTCWGLEMQICPLDAILACDETEPPGADCTTTTDAATTTWIWCAEQPTAEDVSGFTGGRARVFAHQGNNSANEVDFHPKSNSYNYFCCLPRR